jgi:hypothetical protein
VRDFRYSGYWLLNIEPTRKITGRYGAEALSPPLVSVGDDRYMLTTLEACGRMQGHLLYLTYFYQ